MIEIQLAQRKKLFYLCNAYKRIQIGCTKIVKYLSPNPLLEINCHEDSLN